MHQSQGNLAAAEELQVEGLAASRRVNGKEHADTLNAAHNLAAMCIGQGRHAEAEELLAMVLEVRRRVSGEEHPFTLDATANPATTHSQQGRLAEAEELEVGLLATSRRVRGNNHPGTLDAATNLVATCGHQGKHAEAEVLVLEVLETSRRVRGAGHLETIRAARNLATTYDNLGKHADAASLRASYHQWRAGTATQRWCGHVGAGRWRRPPRRSSLSTPPPARACGPHPCGDATSAASKSNTIMPLSSFFMFGYVFGKAVSPTGMCPMCTCSKGGWP